MQFVSRLEQENKHASELVGHNIPLQVLAKMTNSIGMHINFGMDRIGDLAAKHATGFKLSAEVMTQIGSDIASNFLYAFANTAKYTLGQERADMMYASVLGAAKTLEEHSTEGQRTLAMWTAGAGASKLEQAFAKHLFEKGAFFDVPKLGHLATEMEKQWTMKVNYRTMGVSFDLGGEYADMISLRVHGVDTVAKRVMASEPHVAEQFKNMFVDAKGPLRLKDEVVAGATLIDLQLKDQNLIKFLTSDGSSIKDWQKFKTPNIKSETYNYRVHFYKHKSGKVIYDDTIDYLKLKIEKKSGAK